MSDSITRSIDTSVEIRAPLEAVWKALTDAEELVRWFPLEARVEPGAGGSIWMKWDEYFADRSAITVWEPLRHLQLKSAFGIPSEAGRAVPLATDYHLEARGGTTVLRVVASGFGAGADWDELYDGTRTGWAFELWGLKHYLERHRGRDRQVIWARAPFTGSRPEAWARLSGPGGWITSGRIEGLAPGAGYEITTSTGERLQGQVQECDPPKTFAASVENLNGAVLRIRTEMTGPKPEIYVWLQAYGVPDDQIRTMRERWSAALQALFD